MLFFGLLLITSFKNVFPQQLIFRTYTMNDGLVSNNIKAICQDSLGFIWIATEEGLSRFDSRQFQNFTVGEGLREDNVQVVVSDKFIKGAVWISYANGGIDEYKDGKFFHPKQILPEGKKNITSIFESRDSTIWCGTTNSIFRIKNNKIINSDKAAQIGYVNTINEDPSGNILIAADNGLFIYDKLKNIFNKIHNSSNDFNNEIISIFLENNETEWFLENDGTVIKQDGNHYQKITLGADRSYFSITGSEGFDYIYVSSNRGLLKVNKNNPAEVYELNEKKGLPSNNVICSMFDDEGILWIGNNNNGISKLVYPDLFKINKDKYFSSSIIDGNSHAWITTIDGLVEIWKDKNKNWVEFTHILKKFTDESATVFIYYHNGKVMLTYANGVIDEYSVINNNPLSKNSSRLVLINSTDLRSKIKFSGLYKSIEDRENNIWTSALDYGIVVLNSDNERKIIKTYTADDGLPDNSVRTIYEDSKGNFWFGGYDQGLSFFSKDKVMKDLGKSFDSSKVKLIKFTKDNGLADNHIRAIAEDSTGRIIVGMRYGGLSIFSDNKIKNLSRLSGLISNGIWNISIFNKNEFWIATQEGIQKLNKDFTAGSELNEEIPNIPFYSISSKNNFIVFCGLEGFYVYEPAKSKKVIHTSIYFNKFMVNGKYFQLTTNPVLNSDQNNITFEFTQINNIEVKDRIYNYKLLGAEKNWNKLVNKNSVTYASLNPGKYTFRVNSFNPDDTLNESEASISFEIEMPFYYEWWFFTGWFVLLTFLTFIFFNLRNKRRLEIEKLRIKIAGDLHDEIGSGLTKIAILSENALKEQEENRVNFGKSEEPYSDNSITRVGKIARDLVDQMIDVIWSIDPKYDSLNDFVFSFKNFAYETCEAKNINLVINTDNIGNVKVNSQVKRNLQLMVKESLNNAVKYSECSEIIFSLAVKNKNIFLSLTDNGKGFDKEKIKYGKGLLNIQKNTEDLSGICSIKSNPGSGTNIEIRFPVQK